LRHLEFHSNPYELVSRISSLQSTKNSRTNLSVPQLLVSVRSWTEAVQAIDGGADILDIKEPANGSLGMANLETILDIARQISNDDRTISLSVALGELIDWLDRDDVPSLPDEVTFAKLGLYGQASSNDWLRSWRAIRESFDRHRKTPLKWVAVAYADQATSNSPPLEDVVCAAIETRCAGLLIDTFSKTNGTLFDGVSLPELHATADRCHSSGLFLAVAGRVSLESLRDLTEVDADIIAIRSAACSGGNRKGTIDASLVARFRRTMQGWVR
jgi:uncharacterized protein (UPF0264 family)